MDTLTYEYHPSIVSGLQKITVNDREFIIENEKKKTHEAVALTEIRQIRLTLVMGQGICTLHTRQGKKIVFSTRDYQGLGRWVERVEEYRNFVQGLHRRLASQNPSVKYLAGSDLALWLGRISLGTIVLILLFAVASPFLRPDRPFPIVKVLFILIILGLVGVPLWLQGGAKTYSPENLPLHCFPSRE